MQLEHPLLLRCNERFTRHQDQLRQMPKTPNVSSVTDNRAPRTPPAPPRRPGRPAPPRVPACPRRRRARVKNNCLRFISPLSLNRCGLELEAGAP